MRRRGPSPAPDPGSQGLGRRPCAVRGDSCPGAVRSGGCGAVVGPSRRGGRCPRCAGGRCGASGDEHERINSLSHLALAEALRGRLGRAAKLADEATTAGPGDGHGPQGRHLKPAALAALAWVHLEHHELPAARGRLKQVDAALRVSPDRLIGAVACLIAAYGALAEGRADVATQFVARARSAWSVPSWLEQRLSMAESRALAAGGDIEAALAAAKRPAVRRSGGHACPCLGGCRGR